MDLEQSTAAEQQFSDGSYFIHSYNYYALLPGVSSRCSSASALHRARMGVAFPPSAN